MRVGFGFVLISLALAAACASQPAVPQSDQPTIQIIQPTATPAILSLPEQANNPAARPTLAPGQPTPTPEALLPGGGLLPEAGLVKPLTTTPYTLTLTNGSQAIFYPAPQPGEGVLLLVSTAPEELTGWQMLAQSAQVKGLAALVVELPELSAAPQAVQAALQWLGVPANGAYRKVVVSGSGAVDSAVLSAVGAAPEIRASLLFSPETCDTTLTGALKNAKFPVRLVQSTETAVKCPDVNNLEVINTAASGRGVDLLSNQPGLLNQTLEWCLQKLSGN